MEEEPQKPRSRENLSEFGESLQEQDHGFAVHSPGRMDPDPFAQSNEDTKEILPPKAE